MYVVVILHIIRMETLSRQIQLWRAARGLSQKELSERTGIARSNLIDLELGRRDCTVGTLLKLAKALGTTPGQLLDEPPPRKALRLNRFERDTVARAVITGTAPASVGLRRLAHDLRPLFRPSLEAAGLWISRNKTSFVRKRKLRLETLYSDDLIRDVSERVKKLLPSFDVIRENP
ncbi:MAG TPA: helix-turn-helix transcriptional regulator [bacterium]|nr:helix-turn-helix transcriptional regulator [bacterium]